MRVFCCFFCFVLFFFFFGNLCIQLVAWTHDLKKKSHDLPDEPAKHPWDDVYEQFFVFCFCFWWEGAESAVFLLLASYWSYCSWLRDIHITLPIGPCLYFIQLMYKDSDKYLLLNYNTAIYSCWKSLWTRIRIILVIESLKYRCMDVCCYPESCIFFWSCRLNVGYFLNNQIIKSLIALELKMQMIQISDF